MEMQVVVLNGSLTDAEQNTSIGQDIGIEPASCEALQALSLLLYVRLQ